MDRRVTSLKHYKPNVFLSKQWLLLKLAVLLCMSAVQQSVNVD